MLILTMPLNRELLARAVRANPVSIAKLGVKLSSDWPQDTASEDLAQRAALLQKRAGLTVDGIFGENTLQAYKTDMAAARPENYLVVGGTRIPVPFKVVNYEQDPKWSLYIHQKPADKPFRQGFSWRNTWKPEAFILHWDAALTSASCLKILQNKQVSVHLMLDADGTVYQSLDLAFVRAWHAGSNGSINERSVGVEICNPWDLVYERKTGRPRLKSPGVNGNGPHEHLDFFSAQKKVVVQLADAICDIFGIPKRLPRVPEWQSITHADDKDADGSISRGMLVNCGAFTGVAGHYHFEEEKIDPDVALFATELTNAGYK